MDKFYAFMTAGAIIIGVTGAVAYFFPAPEFKGPCHEDMIAHYELGIKSHEMCVEMENCTTTSGQINFYLTTQAKLQACLNSDED